MHYRADIDGLRTVAVVPVVLFHLGVPGLSGGFVGVDVFFVISGYLITSILLREVEAGRFSLLRFYERRARRILPALFAMLAVVTAYALADFLPTELEGYGASLVGAAGFVSNLVFLAEAGYFRPAAESLPLLHTWSLAVEEQFYLVAPLAIAALVPLGRRVTTSVLALGAAGSFVLCLFVTRLNPDAAFYLPITRGWELLAGSLLACGVLPRGGRLAREAMAAGGLGLVALSFALVEPGRGFPGAWAALPVLGTVGLLHAAEGTAAGRLLAGRPLVWIGTISYSLYLWHWPVIVIAGRHGLDPASPGAAFGLGLLSLALAWLSYRLVEQPFRHARASWSVVLGGSGGALAGVLACGAVLVATAGLPSRFADEIVAYDRGREDVSPARERCHLSRGVLDPDRVCVLGDRAPSLAVWADSHGVELAWALAERQPGVLALTYSACAPALDREVANRPDCAAHNARAASFLSGHDSVETIVIAAHWEKVVDDPAFVPGLRAALDRLAAAGKRVRLIGPVPNPGEDVPSRLAAGGSPILPREAFETEQQAARSALAALVAEGFEVVWPEDVLCDRAVCRLADAASRPVLFDDHHLSLAGARLVAEEALRDDAAGPAVLASRVAIGRPPGP